MEYFQPNWSLNIATYFSIGDPQKQCPVDFPYAFNYGNACCYYDKDGQGDRINTRSLNCYSNTYRFCSEDRCLDNCKISYSYTMSYDFMNTDIVSAKEHNCTFPIFNQLMMNHVQWLERFTTLLITFVIAAEKTAV